MANDESNEDAATRQIAELLERYAAALTTNDAEAASALFDQASSVWEKLRASTNGISSDDFLNFAFSSAVGAGSATEAKRIYDAMTDEQRSTVDAAEKWKPGLVKIWGTL